MTDFVFSGVVTNHSELPHLSNMLSQSTLDSLAKPLSSEEPSGPDLVYDPDFLELETLATPKAEQQFGDTIMAREEPNWEVVADKAEALLLRSRDYRVAVTLTRALTCRHGVQGFAQGLRVLISLTQNFWSSLHPQLDAEDDNDPTMRVNALAPLTDYDMLLRELRDAPVAGQRAPNAIRVKDIEAHYSKAFIASTGEELSLDQVQGMLSALHATDPQALADATETLALVKQLQSSINDQVSSQASLDLAPLQNVVFALQQAIKATATDGSDVQGEEGITNAGGSTEGSKLGGLKSRDDAIRLLTQVVSFLERTEPGNPAPLLIKRAQRLIGMNFIDIINDLAPDALGSVQQIAGRNE